MSGGGGSTNYPAPILAGLWSGENQAFTPYPYPGTQQGALNAFNQIGSINTNPNQGYNAVGSTAAGSNLTGVGNQLATIAPQILNFGGQQGENALGTGLNLGQSAYNQGQALGGSALSQFAPFIQPALQQGFDPQSSLFNYLYGQQQNQGNAINAQSGVANTPYGAGMQNQNLQNFDLNWQNQQLQRQQQAAQTAGALGQAGYGTALSGLGTGAGALSSLYGTGLQGLESLFGTGVQGAGSLLGQSANAAAQGTAIGQSVPAFQTQQQQQQIQDYLNYLAASTNNSSAWANAINQSYGQANNQYNIQNQTALAKSQQGLAGLGGIGQALGSIGGLIAAPFTGGLSLGGLGADATLGANILGGF